MRVLITDVPNPSAINPRQEQLLTYAVRSHIETGEPVSSGKLVEDYALSVSPATVRNDFIALEDGGFLYQPHTSAGRIPTQKGFRFYVDGLADSTAPEPAAVRTLERAAGASERALQTVARALCELTGEAIILFGGPDFVYYTGLRNLFSKPEFVGEGRIVELSALLDSIEECLARLPAPAARELLVRIGSEGVCGDACSTISAQAGRRAVYVLLGPLRMDYARNIALFEYLCDLW